MVLPVLFLTSMCISLHTCNVTQSTHVCISNVCSVEFQLITHSQVGTEVGVISGVNEFIFAKSQLSLSVITPFWIIFQVVESKRANALSVELQGHVTLPAISDSIVSKSTF